MTDCRNARAGWAGALAVVRQKGVDRGHDLGAFAHGGGHALDRAPADIADGEDALAAGLESGAILRQILSRAHEALVIELHIALREPVGIGGRTDEEEEVAHRPAGLRAAAAVAPGDRVQLAILALEADDLASGHDLDIGLGG